MHHKYIHDSVSVSPVEGSRVVGSGGGPVTSETHAESSSHTYQHSACSSQPEEGVKLPSLQCSNVQQKVTAIYQLLLYMPIYSVKVMEQNFYVLKTLNGNPIQLYVLVTIDNSWTGIAY